MLELFLQTPHFAMAPKSKRGRKGGSTNDLTESSGAATPVPSEDTGRTSSGLLVSDPRMSDIKIINFSLSMRRISIVEDTNLDFRKGGRYGLIGRNGCGKSTLLKCIAAREIPIPEKFDMYLLDHEASPEDITALDYVIQPAKDEIVRLDHLIDHVMSEEGAESPYLYELYERQEELDPSTFETRASIILRGLGFHAIGAALSKGGARIDSKTKDMSGGWRMRVALARALFIAPSILLLDEPTNHLDLETCVWLEGYLAEYKKILIMCCHSQDFLNGVCTDMLVMQEHKLKAWTGNYDQYIKTKGEIEVNQIKAYTKQQGDIADIKKFIASCGTFANLVKQAQSRQKIIDKMEADGLITMPYVEPIFRFRFHDAGKMDRVLISASGCAFSYTGRREDYLFKNVDFGIWPSSRIALVGPNGAGKSTLIKLMCGENTPCEGTMDRASSLSIGRFHQHSTEVLDLEKTPVEYISAKFANKFPSNRTEEWRGVVGSYGIPSDLHMEPIASLSEGLKTRLVLCEISLRMPHLLLLDEPTNAADMEMIDSMADAIRNFNGGVVVISHDFRLLQQVVQEIWIVDHGIKKWEGDIQSYKALLKKNFGYKKAA